jgi:hypothetical protein
METLEKFCQATSPRRLGILALLVAVLWGVKSSWTATSTSKSTAATSSSSQSSSHSSTPAAAHPSSGGKPVAGHGAQPVNIGTKLPAVNSHPQGGSLAGTVPRMGTRPESMIPGRMLHAPGMTIHRGLNGTRSVPTATTLRVPRWDPMQEILMGARIILA